MPKLPLIALILALLCRALASQEAPAAEDESRFLSNVRQLTFEGKRAGEGYFSADGTQLIFQSEREPDNPFFQIYLMDLETGDIERVSPGTGKTTCAWVHPNGKKVLFASTQDDPAAKEKQQAEFDLRAEGKQRRYSWDYDEYFDIYEYDLAAKTWTNLTHTVGYDAEGCYSPDGKRIVFASNRNWHLDPNQFPKEDRIWFDMNPSFGMDLFAMDADGSNVKQLTTAPGYDGGSFFNADGTKICWRRFSREGDRAEVFTMNADGTGEKQLTTLGALSWAPIFHPSGEYLIFTTNLQGFANFELYLVDAVGEKEPVRVTTTEGFDGLPCFSPDGSQLSWTSNRTADKKSQIFLSNWDHAAALEALGKAGARQNRVKEKATAAKKEVETPAVAGIRDASPEITEADLRAQIAYLASDELEGRMTGTEGEHLATAFVAKAFETWGLSPWDESPASLSYFQKFDFTAGVDLGADNALWMEQGKVRSLLKLNEDWIPLSFSELGNIDAEEIVFAGYGIDVPEGQAESDGSQTSLYTSYYQTDVKNKWVLMLRFIPEDVSGEERRTFLRFASLRYKAMLARQKGATGVIFVSGPNSKVKEELAPLSFDASLAGSGIAALSVTTAVGEQLLAAAGKNLGELQTTLDKGEMMIGVKIPDVRLSAKIDINQRTETGRNVIGRLKAKSPEALNRPALIIGAHVDHLGNKPNSSSRAFGKEKFEIHHGADDNASGTAGLMEIAHYLANAQKSGKIELQRDVVFAAWSGEELGLLGSASFVREVANMKKHDPDAELGNVFSAYLNMDMIGRLDQSLILQGVGSSSIWPGVIERRNVPVGLPLTIQQDTYLSTDATTFYLRGVPILSAFTGAHEDYHRPTDTADKINYQGAQKVAKLMALIARGLATSAEEPDYLKVERPQGKGRRANLRAYLGTIPDYVGNDIEGVKLSGVSKGGPAEKAGLQGGDIIVELDGKELKNIYDYTYVLEALKVGQESKITVLRKGERVELQITPESRD